MDFGHALAVLKAGGRVRRLSWGPSSFLELEPGPAGPLWLWIGPDIESWQAAHDDLLAEDWIGVDATPCRCACQTAPPSGGDNHQFHTATASGGFSQVVHIDISGTVMSDSDIDRLAEKIGKRLTRAPRPSSHVRAERL